MKGLSLGALLLSMALASQASADTYRIYFPLSSAIPASVGSWINVDPTYTKWGDIRHSYGCTNWSPEGSSKTTSATFTQNASDCLTDQSRLRQEREQNTKTHAYRDSGSPVLEEQTLKGQSASRSYTVAIENWATVTGAKALYGCSNYSPAPETVDYGKEFTQTATDCQSDQERGRKEFYVDHLSGETVIAYTAVETQTLSGQKDARQAIGTKDATGIQIISRVSGTNTANKMTNGTFYQGTLASLPPGTLTSFYILIGNYANKSNGSISVSICGINGCVAGEGNVASSVDNKWFNVPMSKPLRVGAGERLTYTVSISSSTSTPAIWGYQGETTGRVSKLTNATGYPDIRLGYQ
ncbi:hypothetical protein ACI2KR_30450 [Pseudomonas luteola]